MGLSFFSKNKIVLFAIIISILTFIVVFFLDKTKSIMTLIPKIRGEISLKNGVVITTTNTKRPILVKKDDPFLGNQLRLSGCIKSVFSDIAKHLCKSGDIVVSVGAYFGYDAILLGNMLTNNGKVYAFEPNYLIFSCLRKSIVLNELENTVKIRNLAILDREGKHEMDDYMSVFKNQNGTFSKPRVIHVACNTLDKELKNEKMPVNILLIDEPGTEFLVLRGASNVIKNSPDIVIIIYFDNELSAKKTNVASELKKLSDDGFNLYLINEEGKKSQPEISHIAKQKEGILVVTKNILNGTSV